MRKINTKLLRSENKQRTGSRKIEDKDCITFLSIKVDMKTRGLESSPSDVCERRKCLHRTSSLRTCSFHGILRVDHIKVRLANHKIKVKKSDIYFFFFKEFTQMLRNVKTFRLKYCL